MPRPTHPADDFNQKGTEFLKTELNTGLTLAEIALGEEPGSGERAKGQYNARKAYDTFLRLRGRIEVAESERRELQVRLNKLRAALEQLGEKLGNEKAV